MKSNYALRWRLKNILTHQFMPNLGGMSYAIVIPSAGSSRRKGKHSHCFRVLPGSLASSAPARFVGIVGKQQAQPGKCIKFSLGSVSSRSSTAISSSNLAWEVYQIETGDDQNELSAPGQGVEAAKTCSSGHPST